MHLISFLLRSSWKMLAIAIAMGFVSGGSSAGTIALVSRAIASGSEASSSAIALNIDPAIAWGFVGLAAIALLTSIAARILLIRLSQDAVFHLQMRLSRQILASELSHLERLGSPRLLATLTEDVQAISNAVYVLPFLCINLAITAGGLLYITWLSWSMFLAVMGLSAIAFLSTRILLRNARHLLALARDEQDSLFKHFRALTAGTKELKLHAARRKDFLTGDLAATASRFRRYTVRGLSLFATTDSWGKLIFFFAIGLVLFVLPHWFAIAPQTLAGYILTFTYLMGPMENIVNKLPLIGKANIALQKIEALGLSLVSHQSTVISHQHLTAKQRSGGAGGVGELGEQRGQASSSDICPPILALKNVTHTYPSDDERPFVLGPVDLNFYGGEIVFIIGGNGSGKSTLAKLITGLYAPETGEIHFRGQPITAENREWYRQHFSAIFADFYLFDRLLGFNLEDLDTHAQNYLKHLQLDRKVSVNEGKLSTTNLSQGQRKRLALLTAYLEDRPIYLFDEWAADQDPTFKDIFYTEFLPQLRDRGKTILAISHDDRYFHCGDRLIKLDYGKIDEKNFRTPS